MLYWQNTNIVIWETKDTKKRKYIHFWERNKTLRRTDTPGKSKYVNGNSFEPLRKLRFVLSIVSVKRIIDDLNLSLGPTFEIWALFFCKKRFSHLLETCHLSLCRYLLEITLLSDFLVIQMRVIVSDGARFG